MEIRACAPCKAIFKGWIWWHQSQYSCLGLMEYFTFQDKFIAYMSDGGSNLKTCQDALDVKVTNTAIYRTQQTMFQKDCFAHALKDAWNADVLDCKSEDDEGIISVCIATVWKILTTCVTWAKNSSLGSRALTKAQNYVGLKPCKMLTPIKTRRAYFISALQCII